MTEQPAAAREPRINLRIPGPTPVPPRVVTAMTRPMMNHRGPEFGRIYRETVAGLARVFETQNEILCFTASGTGGLEAAVVNTLSPGDRVLAVSIGNFGDRFAGLARRFGADIVDYQVTWGEAADPAELERRLREDGPFKAVLITHNETSTGIVNPLQTLGPVVRASGALLLVDAVSSLAAIELKTDEWGCDVVVSASQKAFMVPPGLALVSVSERAWAAGREARMPRYYWDFEGMRQAAKIGSTPFTPAVSLFYGLHEALKIILDERDLATFQAYHTRIMEHTRARVRAIGLEPFAADRVASPTVTTVRVPAGVDIKGVLTTMREERGIVLATGQAKLQDTTFRIGHLGHVDERDIDEAIDALAEVLRDARRLSGTPA